MPLQFQTVEEPSFGRGIDARSAENQIREGFVRDLVNADIVEGRVRKRKGSADFAGKIPLRATSFRQALPDKLYIRFDSSVDLSRLTGNPLLVYGKSSTITTGGPFTTAGDTYRYYDNWFTNITKLIPACGPAPTYTPATGTITADVSEHNIQTSDIFTGLAGKPGNVTNLTNYNFFADTTIDSTNYAITVDYTNGTPNAIDTYLFYQNGTPIVGEIYAGTVTVSTSTISIDQPTHNLNSTNIRYSLFKEDGSDWRKVIPDNFSVNQSTGEVTITLNGDPTERAGDYRVLLATVPQSQTIDTNLSSVSSTIPTLNDGSFTGTVISNVESPYLFYTFYERNQLNSNVLDEIFPDEIWYDDDNKRVEVVFSNESDGKNVIIHYDYGTIRANELYVISADIGTTTSDPTPQLTVYGLDHTTIYGSEKEIDRRGWVTHLDSYRSPSTTHMVAGLGGNLFAPLSPGQMYPSSGTVLPMAAAMPIYYPNLNTRVDSSWPLALPNIGPAFYGTGTNPKRKRPVLTFNGGDSHWATVYKVQYDALNNRTDYYLRVPGRQVIGGSGFLSEVISTASGKEDYLTLQGMSHSRHNGTFKIVSTYLELNPVSADYLILSVTNPNITSSDYDDDTCAGLGGVFTDQIALTSSPFLVNDTLLSSAWGSELELKVVSVDTVNDILVVNNLYNPVELSPGLTIAGKRTSATIPLRYNNTATVDNIVVGDTISCSDFDRPLQVTAIDIVNKSITVDESFTWEDNIALPTLLSVAARWIPAEVPVPLPSDPNYADYALIPKTTVQHLSANPYGNQPFLRSAMVQNNLYLTNGNDEVYKYDGYNFYRAGMIPWQPGLFLSTENVASGGIPLAGSGLVAVDEVVGGKLRLTTDAAAAFQVNDVVRFSNDEGVTQILTIAVIAKADSSETKQVLSFKETLDFTAKGTNPKLTLLYSARYAFRLNIRDINGVTTASAVTGAEDFVAVIAPETGKQTRVLLRLVGLPPWDQYDYRNKNIELEVYRTLWTRSSLGEVPVFYRIQTVGLTYENNSGYIDIVDSYSNQTLTQTDNVVGVLSPDVVPADWDEPARAKYVTTTGNRLVLANVTDWPTLTLTYLDAGSNSFADFDNQTFLFKKDSDDSDTDTNMTDRVRYEFRQASESIETWPCDCGVAGQFKFVSATQSPAIDTGDWVYLYHKNVTPGSSLVTTANANNKFSIAGTIPNNTIVHFSCTGNYPVYTLGGVATPITPGRGYFVVESNSNSFEIALTRGGTPLDITTIESGVLTVLWDGSELDYAGWWQIRGVDSIFSTLTAGVTGSTTITIAGDDASRFPAASNASPVAILINGTPYNYSAKTGPVAGVYTLTTTTPVTAPLGATVTLVGVSRYTVGFSGSNLVTIPTQFPDRLLKASIAKDVPVLIGTDGNMGMFNGNGPLPWLVALRRLGMAINATMRVVDTTLPDYDDFVPWLIARSEGDTGGQLVVKQPRAEVTTVSLTLGGSGPARYVNGSLPSPNPTTPVKAVTTRYPSRLLVSYNNYPEIFDNPWTVDTDQSDSAIDINSADGQEITGVIPFFGESAFGASLQSGVLVVFKQNSIYLVDLAAKASGQNSVQRLETQGLGCTAPYSIAPTKDGIAFANDSGIYVLRRNQRIEYLGRFVERLWQGSVRKDFLDIVQGHHYGVGRQYKLSVPIKGEGSFDYASNSQVYVYNHTGEEADGLGGWARYTNHPATGWANLFQDAFYASVNGAVLRLRNLDEEYDYRDGNEKIETVLETRAVSFGNTAIRKVVSHVTVHYRSTQNSGVVDNVALNEVLMSTDLNKEYQPSTTFRVITNPSISDGLSTISGQDIVSIMHSIGRRRCIYMAIKITNNGLNDNVEIAGISYTVSALSGAGVKQAAETD